MDMRNQQKSQHKLRTEQRLGVNGDSDVLCCRSTESLQFSPVNGQNTHSLTHSLTRSLAHCPAALMVFVVHVQVDACF